MTEIRRYQDTDLEALRALLAQLQAYEKQFDPDHHEPTPEFARWYSARALRLVAEQQGIVLVAVEDAQVCGVVAGYIEEDAEKRADYFYISDLAVAESHRGRGIGTALLLAIEDHARMQGFAELGIGVIMGNELALALYHKLGFRDQVIFLKKKL